MISEQFRSRPIIEDEELVDPVKPRRLDLILRAYDIPNRFISIRYPIVIYYLTTYT
jgi:hypothetical protein